MSPFNHSARLDGLSLLMSFSRFFCLCVKLKSTARIDHILDGGAFPHPTQVFSKLIELVDCRCTGPCSISCCVFFFFFLLSTGCRLDNGDQNPQSNVAMSSIHLLYEGCHGSTTTVFVYSESRSYDCCEIVNDLFHFLQTYAVAARELMLSGLNNL